MRGGGAAKIIHWGGGEAELAPEEKRNVSYADTGHRKPSVRPLLPGFALSRAHPPLPFVDPTAFRGAECGWPQFPTFRRLAEATRQRGNEATKQRSNDGEGREQQAALAALLVLRTRQEALRQATQRTDEAKVAGNAVTYREWSHLVAKCTGENNGRRKRHLKVHRSVAKSLIW